MNAKDLLALTTVVKKAEKKAFEAYEKVWQLERSLKNAKQEADSLRFMAEEYATELSGIEKDIMEGKEVSMPYWFSDPY